MKPYVLMLFAALAFATMGGLANALRDDFAWQLVALARSVVPLAITGGMLLAARIPAPVPGPAVLWSRSIAGSVSLACTFFALACLPVSDVLTLTNLVPIWVAIFSWPLLGQRQPADVWAAVLLGVAGVALSQQEFLLTGQLASIVAILASLSSAVAMVSLHRIERLDPRAIVFHFSSVSTLMCLVLSAPLALGPLPVGFGSPLLWLMLLGVGLAATVGQFFLTVAYMTGNPARISVVGLSQVGFAMAYDLWLSNRPFSFVRFSGILLVLVSTAWVLLSLANQSLESCIGGEADGTGIPLPPGTSKRDEAA